MSTGTEITEQQRKMTTASHGLPSGKALIPGSDLRPALAVATILAIVVALGLPGEFEPVTRLVCVWDAFILVMLAKMWRIIVRSTAESCHLRASADDPGILIILFVSVLGGIAGLVGAVFLVRRPDPAMLQVGLWLEIILVSIAVAGGWLLLQSANALHYAKLYYADDGTPGGLQFEGGQPDDIDFAYVAFTVGMTFQVSDVVVTDKGIRRFVLFQALISFIYNLAIFALVINLVASKI